jgi:hypothetical protein
VQALLEAPLSPPEGGGDGVLTNEPARWRRIAFGDGPRQVSWELHLADFPGLLERWSRRGSGPSHRPVAAPPDAVLFDAFSPRTNPAMWTLPLFSNLFRLLDPGRPCVMPTYSRSTLLRVTLLLAGFHVGSGQATGRKEETTIAANTPALIEAPLDRRWLRRARRSTSAEPLRQPTYRQAPLSPESWEQLEQHAQFR